MFFFYFLLSAGTLCIHYSFHFYYCYLTSSFSIVVRKNLISICVVSLRNKLNVNYILYLIIL